MGNVPPTGPDTPGGQPDWGEMKGKLTAAKGADRMILIAGVVFLVDSFLPWYGVGIGSFRANVSGWNAGGVAVLSILLALAATLFAAARVIGAKVSLGGINDGVVYLVTGGGALVFALLRWITESSFTKYGLYIAIVAGAFLAAGGFQKFKSAKA